MGAHWQVLIEHILCSDYWAANTVVGTTDPGSDDAELTVQWGWGNEMTVQKMITVMTQEELGSW